ncbi:MAG: DUF1931 domain-containing protein [Candidatus Woesearchaeota archaeon]
MSLVVKAKIREYAKIDDKVLNVSGDFADKLSEKVESMIREACKRAKDNGRSTVMAKDL